MAFKAIICTLLLAGGALAAGTSTAARSAVPLDELSEIGSGELRWFGMEVYAARLLSGTGRFETSGETGPLALEITYRRNISRERLLHTTAREWGRLGTELGLNDRARAAGWLSELGEIWPDVGPGDRIVAFVEPDGATRFYGNDAFLGAVTDPRFGPAFLGIWLHPDTRAADLRARLLGEVQ